MEIDLKKLSSLFETSKSEVVRYCNYPINNKIKYKDLSNLELKKILNKIIYKIHNDKQVIAAKSRKKIWHDGWNESLNLFKKQRDINSLIPKYITKRENRYFRLKNKFIKTNNKNFEYDLLSLYRNWYYKKFFKKVDNIYEFGAGTGINLFEMFKIYPKKNYYGSDFVKSSVNLMKLMKKENNIKLKSFLFDISKPDRKIKIKKNSAVYTSGALEQLSGKIFNFLNYLIEQKPKIVLHSEPVLDFYKEDNLPDILGKLFHLKRGYTSNLFSLLKIFEKQEKIKIIKTVKSPFGSLMMEGYSLIVWKPK